MLAQNKPQLIFRQVIGYHKLEFHRLVKKYQHKSSQSSLKVMLKIQRHHRSQI